MFHIKILSMFLMSPYVLILTVYPTDTICINCWRNSPQESTSHVKWSISFLIGYLSTLIEHLNLGMPSSHTQKHKRKTLVPERIFSNQQAIFHTEFIILETSQHESHKSLKSLIKTMQKKTNPSLLQNIFPALYFPVSK